MYIMLQHRPCLLPVFFNFISGDAEDSEDRRISSLADNIDSGSDAAVWTETPTILLFDVYERKKLLHLRKKVLWNHVSKELGDKGYKYTPDQVAGRWKTLTRQYKAARDNNRKSGNVMSLCIY